MNNDGKNISTMVAQMRRLCEQIAKLLGTASEMMREKGWECVSNATADNSVSLSKPRLWIPEYFCQFWMSENNSGKLSFISVILDNRENDSSFQIKEPLLTAGWLDYGPRKKVDDWKNASCTWHVFMPGRKDDGSLLVANPKKAWPDEEHPFIRISTFGVPLTSVTDAESLKSKIIDPLLKGLEKK